MKKFRNDQSISPEEGFEAPRIFLTAFWERDGRPDDGLMRLLSFCEPVGKGGSPSDPAQWSDWLDAIEQARGKKS